MKSRKCELHCGLERFLIPSKDISKPTIVDMKDTVTPSHKTTSNKRNNLNYTKIKSVCSKGHYPQRGREWRGTHRMGETICKPSSWWGANTQGSTIKLNSTSIRCLANKNQNKSNQQPPPPRTHSKGNYCLASM